MRNSKTIFESLYHVPCCGICESWPVQCKDHLDFIQRLDLLYKLPVHKGCVNTISWNESGSLLLSGSDDRFLVITDPFQQKVLWRYKTAHKANIFSAKFLPDGTDSQIISCSGDGMILHTDKNVGRYSDYEHFTCHYGAVYEVETSPIDPTCFMTCGEDGSVRWVDLRMQDKCSKRSCHENIMVSFDRASTALCCNRLRPYQVAVGNADSTVRLIDRRFLGQSLFSDGKERVQSIFAFTLPDFHGKCRRITSINFSPELTNQSLLVSFSSEDVYLFNIDDQMIMKLVRDGTINPLPPRRLSNGQHQIHKIRMRGDWSDTGPSARPEREAAEEEVNEARSLMHRITNVLARLLNDPVTRAALYSRDERSESSPSGENSSPKRNFDETLTNEPLVFNLPFRQKFTGHRNVRTMIKEATFWGSKYVMSGSDCGHIFVWDRDSGEIVMLLQGDGHVVNCVQPHPTLPYLATSGIDHDIKIWAPIRENSSFSMDRAQALMKRNAQMLLEARDTITVPASFMIRMIARINQRRRLQQQAQQNDNTVQ